MASSHDEALAAAESSFAAGRLEECAQRCARLLAEAPDDPGVLHLAAVLQLVGGDAAAALAHVDRALRLRPGDARQHHTRGLALRAAHRLDEAVSAFREAARLAPELAEAQAALGQALLTAGDPAAAREPLERAVSANPRSAEWRYNLALCDSRCGRHDAALEGARAALALKPDFAPALLLAGAALTERGDHRGAADAFAGAVAANPAGAEGHNNLGAALLAQGRLADAEASFRRAVELAPHHSHAWNNLGNALRRRGRPRDALDAYRAATSRKPELANAWANLGNLLREHDRIEESLDSFARALEIEPGSAEAHFSLAIAHLLRGDMAQGWREYPWRQGRAPNPSLQAALAQGRAFEVEGEQGLGDVLFFLRWAPALAARAPRVRFRGDARLFPLLRPLGIFESMIETGAPGEPGAVKVASGDLPWLLGDGAPTHPAPLALKPPRSDLERAQALLVTVGPPPYVGVAWRAGIASHGGEEHLFKKVDLEAFGAALKGLPGTLVGLQRAPEPRESEELAARSGGRVADLSGLNAELPLMLAVLDLLDDYVGVSSTNVHLRAGLGKGARILVPSPAEWRYGRAGSASAWFPGFELYREERGVGWGEALARLAADLRGRFGARP